MTSAKMLPAMDIHQHNEEHEVQYRLSNKRYPDETSNDEFELFVCVYNPDHKVNSKTWRKHLKKCQANYGGDMVICRYNASHHVPRPEAEWHEHVCDDKYKILQGFAATGQRQLATQVNHHPVWNAPEPEEDWDSEIADAPAPDFQLDTRMGMPLNLQAGQSQKDPQNYVACNGNEQEYEEEANDTDTGELTGQNGEIEDMRMSILTEELLPEKPPNWNDMTKVQKNNYKKKYRRQQKRMADAGVTVDDFQQAADQARDTSLWTEEQCNQRLQAIKARFPMAPDKQNATRFDFTSLLNVVCQKCKIRLPKFEECTGAGGQGGYAYKCLVKLTWHFGKEYCSNKKDAKHECAKCALLEMEIPGLDTDEQFHGPNRQKPIHPSLAANARLREGDEVARLMASGVYYEGRPALRQPNLQPSPKSSPVRSSASVQQQQQQQQQQKQQQQQRQQPQQQQRQQQHQQQSGWGQRQLQPQVWRSQQQGVKNQSQDDGNNVVTGMNNMHLNNTNDFPSLGGASGGWSTVTKKDAAGVSKPPQVRGRGRGRGRGTTMKL